MKKTSWLLFVLFVVGSLALAACGGTENVESDAEDSADSGETNETEAAESSDAYTVGISQFVEHPSLDAATEGFKKGIEDSGLTNVTFDVQNAQNDMSNNQTIADNFVSDQVDLIFANSTPSAQSALNATADIPIVFTSVTDPIGAELVPSMDEAGGNITGTTDNHPDAIPNTVQFIDEQTEAKKIGMVYNAGEQNSVAQVEMVKQATEGTDLEIVEASVSNSAEVQQATESLVGRADVFYIITDNTVVSALESVIGVANDQGIPLFVGELDSVERGGLAAYGFDYYDIGYQAGEMAASVLKGEKEIAEIAPQYPNDLKLVMNQQAAKDMGVEIKDEWKSLAEFIE
ncbi:ABC transporter substrate-binding protein [Pontibacillus litoralis]|uniref:ABC transporter substrate-binding protein n=1 Tax=Pontibacillus litoralis JSM 072002 TaxID=1385512 RepID=A0A0A5G498_9BACI|nr:ABC transporter substrate-binding protein [Pontibacillus litoralis]KGX86879.1 ABC transporter substrate-binding protein [Pontibacillus litoralis JSM 072002]